MKGRQGFVVPRRITSAAPEINLASAANSVAQASSLSGPQGASGDISRPTPADELDVAPAQTECKPPTKGLLNVKRAPLATLTNVSSSGAYGGAAPLVAAPKRPLLPAGPANPVPAKQPKLQSAGLPAEPVALAGQSLKPSAAAQSGPAAMTEVHAVLYTKKELLAKKKASKKFADGVITIFEDGTAMLYDQDCKVVTKGRYKAHGRQENGDYMFEIGNWHMEYDKSWTVEDFKRGACFLSSSGGGIAPPAMAEKLSLARNPGAQAFKPHVPAGGSAAASGPGAAAKPGSRPINGGSTTAVAPVHDPTTPDAVVLNSTQWNGGAGRSRDGKLVVPVVIDPYLCRHLRPHQVEGVRFMYEAVMGLKASDKTGCILADEMGLGKTLQVITLAWTLLRQSPQGGSLARKVLVVTPASLVDNWGREVKKWLGSERLQALCLQQSQAAKQSILEFRHGAHQRMMITSYETLRKHAGEMAGMFDLLVCDEGHRLKSVGGNKTIDALLSLNCNRRILLTGTPVQNDLQEFYALLSFVVPDLLGTTAAFNRVYGIPITRSQEGTATVDEKELGAARASELQAQVFPFILRRTQGLLAKHLPPLTNVVLFCRPAEQQLGLYGAVLRSKAVTSLLYGSGSGGDDNTLAIITALRKVANHPDLMLDPTGVDTGEGAEAGQGRAAPVSSCLPSFNDKFSASGSYEASGKMRVLAVLLKALVGRGERCVVVSTSTAALDLVARMVCRPLGLSTVRIDGGTSVDERQNVVDDFNKLGMGQVFLLSTRAGGAGLNLIGANHLVLYDSDWNPAMDLQAMARIWRDGQTRPCFVYRTLTTGTIEEKVYQRQLMKADLASATMAGGGGAGGKSGGKFTREELRALFSLNTATASDTRDLLPPGRVPGLSWVDPEEVPADGSPLAAAAACGLVTCICREAKTAQEGGDGAAAAGRNGSGPLQEVAAAADAAAEARSSAGGDTAGAAAPGGGGGSQRASQGAAGALAAWGPSRRRLVRAVSVEEPDDASCLAIEDE